MATNSNPPPGPPPELALHAEVAGRFGVLPNFFRLVPDAPGVMTNLWGFAKFAYLDLPLPSLFKERLFVYLSRFCDVRYCIARHVGFLVGLGRPSGDEHCTPQKIEEVVRLLRRPLPRGEDLGPHLELLGQVRAASAGVPAADTSAEEAVFACVSHVFLQTPQASACMGTLRKDLGEVVFQQIIVFLTFVRAAHYWTKTHAELEMEDDIQRLLATHEALAECILNDSEASTCEMTQVLREEVAELRREQKLRALAESEERFRVLVTATSDVVYRMSPDWSEMRQLHGRKFIADTAAPNPTWLQEYVHPDDRPRVLEAIAEAIRTKSTFELEHRVLRVDGSPGWTFLHAVPRLDAESDIVEWFGTATDVTLRREAEEAVRRQAEQLRENDRKKDEFLAMLAHELRNPLSAIGNAVALASRGGLQEHMGWAMEVVARQMRHLTHLIDDLLDVSRINRGKIALRRAKLDLTPILDSAAATVQPLVQERKHTLELAADRGNLWSNIDPTRIEQVVVNLLNNAAKYSENGGQIRLSARNVGDEVVISVRDRGQGIPPEKLPQMFELFTQGDRSLGRSEGGLGIGLTVVKKLVELHGGSVAAASEGPGRGSEFTVRLPRVERPPAVSPSSLPAAEKSKAARILIIDDSVDTARGMAQLLGLLGHEVVIAHTGLDGIERARERRFGFILLDIGLPGMNGYEVALHLRQEGCCRDAVLIAVSGYGQDEDRRRSKAAGIDHHLIKPVNHDALIALLSAGGNGRG
jgi:signal transduction histidine kinase/ActR/RegA family two-component response regulator